jgi:hypothetical protein
MKHSSYTAVVQQQQQQQQQPQQQQQQQQQHLRTAQMTADHLQQQSAPCSICLSYSDMKYPMLFDLPPVYAAFVMKCVITSQYKLQVQVINTRFWQVQSLT